MFSKIGVAVAMLAVGSFLAMDPAAAQGRNGGKNGGKKVAKVAKQANQANRRHRVARNHAQPVPRAAHRSRKDRWQRTVGRAIVTAAQILANEPRVAWRDRGFRNRPWADHRCVAVARRGGGFGRRIGIRAEGYGRRACRKAMRRCNRQLDYRQSFGRNPYAACVIARRG